jgi:hypothetical protein
MQSLTDDLIQIYPETLSGPSSYFTDIDPSDQNYNKEDAIQKLKLQLLTKERIVVAASSLFHDIWLDLFRDFPDLIPSLKDGIIVPAIRNNFSGIADFFSNKKYSDFNKSFFTEHVTHSVPWDLRENTEWFRKYFVKGLLDENSVLRKQGGINIRQANDINLRLQELIDLEPVENRFLQRSHVESVAKGLNDTIEHFLINYANLIYRLSGARVVNSEGHFPQSNLTNLKLVGNDEILSDEGIFWDLYAETVFSYLGTAIRLTPDRLKSLKFSDILTIRKALFDKGFSLEYDKLVGLVKSETNITDPDKLILHMQEISQIAIKLKESFSKRITSELSIRDTKDTENALWQVTNALALLASPHVGLVVGVLSSFKSLPEITAPMSSGLSNSLHTRIEWMRNFANSKLGWSNSQRKAFIDAYKILVTYGL